jgi:uncharacterized protein with HEPN domain
LRLDREWLLDILEAIERIGKYAAEGKDAFLRDELRQVWIVHHLEIIGEAANRLSDALRDQHPEVPWADVIAMRNVLVHQYFGIDLEEVWSTAETDLPALKRNVVSMLKGLGDDDEA